MHLPQSQGRLDSDPVADHHSEHHPGTPRMAPHPAGRHSRRRYSPHLVLHHEEPIIGTTAIKRTIRRHTNNEKLSLNSVIMSRPANCPCIFPYKLISFYILSFSLEWTNF